MGTENLNLIDKLIDLFQVRQFDTVVDQMKQYKKELKPEYKEILIYLTINFKAREYIDSILAIFDTIKTRPAIERDVDDGLPHDPKEYFHNENSMKKLVKVVFRESIRSNIESLIKILLKRDSKMLKMK